MLHVFKGLINDYFLFQARLRMGNSFTDEEKKEKVEAIITEVKTIPCTAIRVTQLGVIEPATYTTTHLVTIETCHTNFKKFRKSRSNRRMIRGSYICSLFINCQF